jgi:nucleoid-associated protein YgaU
MGLFDFAKEIGEKLFTSDAEAATKISDYLALNNPGVTDLSVIFKDGLTTLIGVTDKPEAAQKAVLLAGNVKGVEKVVSKIDITDASSTSSIDSAAALEPSDVEYYVIASGDTLSKIAKRVYGNANDYQRIFEANREVIKDPDKIYVGQKIRIPLN